MKIPKFPALFPALAVLLASCSVGPNYQSPKTTSPAKWNTPLSGGETHSIKPVAAWWKTFRDPELDSLVDRAVKANPDLKIAEARVREVRAQYRMQQSAFGPTVDAGGFAGKDRVSRRMPLLNDMALAPTVPLENETYLAGFQAAWEIDVFGGTRRAVEAAGAEVGAAEYGRRNALVILLAEVGRNYVELRGGQRRLEIAQKNIKAQTEALEIARDRYKNGLTSELDVQQAIAVLTATQAEIPRLQTLVQASINRIDVLLGQQPGTLTAQLSKPARIPATPPMVPVGLPSELLCRRPDVQQAERQLAAANARIGVATSDLFPKFYLTGGGGNLSVSSDNWFSPNSQYWSFGPTAQWRIFDTGRIRANIKVQNARQEQALISYEKTVLTSFEETENALTSYAKEQVRRQSLEESAKASREALQMANQLYTKGLVSFINVIDAERSLYQSEDSLVQSDKAVSQNLIALYKALGGGWE